jgi:hypothetical protein
MKLAMKDLDIDTYTATFERLASAAGWEPNAMGTIARYRAGLRENVHRRVVNRENIPTTMAEWKEAAQKEVNRIRELQNAGLIGFRNNRGRDQSSYQTNTSRSTNTKNNGVVPMDVDATNTVPFKKLTEEERAQYRAEGRCFRCRSQGHMARNCPKNNRQNTIIRTNTTTSIPPPSSDTTIPTKQEPKLTIAQQIRALENQMSEEERGAYLDARDMGEDFCSAEL